jgi:hypothetical protein
VGLPVLRPTSGSISKKQAERTISPGLFFCLWAAWEFGELHVERLKRRSTIELTADARRAIKF